MIRLVKKTKTRSDIQKVRTGMLEILFDSFLRSVKLLNSHPSTKNSSEFHTNSVNCMTKVQQKSSKIANVHNRR